MSALVCKLLGLFSRRGRSRPEFDGRPGPASDGRARLPAGNDLVRSAPTGSGVPGAGTGRWDCAELGDQPLTPTRLRMVRELVVRRPAALTLEVLAAAPALLAVVLLERGPLPRPVAAELARRQIATVWRLRSVEPPRMRTRSSVRSVPTGCAVTRRGTSP
jgi:hypothetical protein